MKLLIGTYSGEALFRLIFVGLLQTVEGYGADDDALFFGVAERDFGYELVCFK